MAKGLKKVVTNGKLLTETELELMGILWSLGEGSVTEVMGHLPKGRDLAYTSVSTILRILEQKQIVGSRKEGRGHIYYPILQKERYEEASLSHLLTKVFDGSAEALVSRLIETKGLTPAALSEIRALLDRSDDKHG